MLRSNLSLSSRIGRSTLRTTRCFGSDASDNNTPPLLNKYSQRITQPKSQGASQAMLHAVGLTREDMSKPQVGISSMWWEGNPCNMHLLDLADLVKQGVNEAGMVGLRFNTIGVSDGISMGTSGMSYSLQSRDLIADSVETVMSAQWYDANVSIPGCDKNMPGVVMALGRVNRPGLVVYGGSTRAGCSKLLPPLETGGGGEAAQGGGGGEGSGHCQRISESYGESLAGSISEQQRQDVVENSCPGAGACGGMYTANTMASAIEALGLSLPGGSSSPADSEAKKRECLAAGPALKNLLEMNLRPRDIVTRASLENAMALTMALGGSTNAVLHLLAIAHAFDISLDIDDFQATCDRVPFLADLKPSGRFVMEDLDEVGGVVGVMKLLLAEGLIDGSCLTVTGKTIAENLSALPPLVQGQDIVRPVSEPLKSSGHIHILRGNVAPEGSVAKITGKEGTKFKGSVRVFDSEEEMLEELERGGLHPRQQAADDESKIVVVIRYEGPKGGPGMPEMLTPTSAVMGAGLGDHVAMLTDGRFSGGSHGFIIGHISPEAQEGGPLALLQDGDEVTIDCSTLRIDALVSDNEMQARRDRWVAPALKHTRGTLHKYTKTVSSASLGCVTDE